ncbi:MAG: geranylgeranyl reductase family protein [Microthrixaceae bacterium]
MSAVRTVDVLVVGAGPAGTAAAITLAGAGIDTLVVDKAVFPRDKTCGDGLTSSALRHLEDLGLKPDMVDSWQSAETCWIRSPSGALTPFTMPQDRGAFIAVAKRVDLDFALVELARKAGAEVADGHGLRSATEDDTGVTAQIDGIGEVRARYAIGADGMYSPLRKHLGASPNEVYLGEWHAFRQYFSNVGELAARDLYISFEADLVPGYFWSFPLPGGGANVGFGIQRTPSTRTKEMKSLWGELLTRPHIAELLGPGATPEAPHKAWPIPARVDQVRASTKRALFVGDAVAACDVMSGEGIGQALITGIGAAELIRDQAANPDLARLHDQRVRLSLLADHRMSRLLVKGLSSPRGANMATAIASANDWTRRNFARWLFEDYPRALVATPRRWRRGAISQPGSFVDS